MNKTVAVLIAGELYLLSVLAVPVQADGPELADVKALLAAHSDASSGMCGAACVDFGPQGAFKVADDGGNSTRLDIAETVEREMLKKNGGVVPEGGERAGATAQNTPEQGPTGQEQGQQTVK